MTYCGEQENDVALLPVAQKSGVHQSGTVESNKPEQSTNENSNTSNPLE